MSSETAEFPPLILLCSLLLIVHTNTKAHRLDLSSEHISTFSLQGYCLCHGPEEAPGPRGIHLCPPLTLVGAGLNIYYYISDICCYLSDEYLKISIIVDNRLFLFDVRINCFDQCYGIAS